MIRAVFFDLDGVLIDAKEWHYDALNVALAEVDPKLFINKDQHEKIFDGLPTRTKLELLASFHKRILTPQVQQQIMKRKQELFMRILEKNLKRNQNIVDTIDWLKSRGFRIACCTNSVAETANRALKKLDILEKMDYVVHNGMVTHPKPSPEMYNKALDFFGFAPDEVVVVEDNPNGIMAAKAAKCYVVIVNGSNQITIENMKKAFDFLGLYYEH